MKTFWFVAFAAMLSLVTTPALADEAWQVFECQLVDKDDDDDSAEDDVIAAAEKWLTAARSVPGGEEMELRIIIPHAANSGDVDFLYVISTPSFTAWGTFWDNYEDSAAHKIDEESDEITLCPSSRLYEVVRVEPN